MQNVLNAVVAVVAVMTLLTTPSYAQTPTVASPDTMEVFIGGTSINGTTLPEFRTRATGNATAGGWVLATQALDKNYGAVMTGIAQTNVTLYTPTPSVVVYAPPAPAYPTVTLNATWNWNSCTTFRAIANGHYCTFTAQIPLPTYFRPSTLRGWFYYDSMNQLHFVDAQTRIDYLDP